ncbi:MAG TPA: HDIG domain-containing protein [Candidatus Caenarcaniphilales bacterium]|nr:HDIG domain-containing protein [Candidatus Caenarcaniphilales bacterium]
MLGIATPARDARPFTRRDALRLLVIATLLITALGSVLALDAISGPFVGRGAVVDDVATVEIRAPRAATFESTAATNQRREEVREQVPPQYDWTQERGQATADRQLAAFEEAVAPVDAAFGAILMPEDRQEALRAAMPHLSTSALTTLQGLDRVGWTKLSGEMVRVLETAQRLEVRDTLLPEARGSLRDRVSTRFSPDQRALAGEILAPLPVANSTFDPVATKAAEDDAASRVDPVRFSIRKGEIIVQRGERLDDVAREKLALFGLLDPRPDPARAGGWMLLAALVVTVLLAWIWRFRPDFWHRNNALLLIGLVLVATALALKATGDRSVLPYLLPTAAAGLLLAVLLDSTAAVVVTAILSVIGGAIVGTVEFTAYVFVGGLAGIVIVRRGERLAHFVQAAIVMAAVNLAVVTLFTLLGDRDVTGLFELWGASIAAAGGAAIVALGSFVVLGNLFGITTSFQLLEQANPSQPLLRRLLLETPGTYHHSLMVGNLGERAAEAIGADPLLTRVAAYYHDIGKLANPLAFIENQAGTANVHDELTPEQSVSLLKSHVANGIDLAYHFKLPKAIIPFIPQHHGTALMSYFYARAKEQAIEAAGARPGTPQAEAAAATVDERGFRHAGPKPQSREAAILMLADGVEASVRSLTSQDEPAIRAMVERIIRERLEDGQLDESDVTLRDLEQIREAFVAQLLGMYHRRIEYPQNKIVEIESRRAVSGRGKGA